jgi:multiple sugar transport system substrate-binding protein
MWAAPWLCGARVIYYRRDILDKAGVNPATAFSSPSTLLQTVAQLHEAGITRPWTTSTTSSLNTLHLICSWIWGTGGDLLSQDGKSLLFAEETVLRSITDFFALGRYMGPDPQDFSFDQAIQRFWSGEAAVTIDGTWMYQLRKKSAHPVVLDNLGVAMTPGPAFIGGSNLAIWTTTTDKTAAQELLSFLVGSESTFTICNLTGLSPVKLEALHAPEYVARPFGEVMNQAIETGRSTPNYKFSGLVENKLRHALGMIWKNIFTQPDVDPYEIVAKTLIALKKRLEVVIQEGVH